MRLAHTEAGTTTKGAHSPITYIGMGIAGRRSMTQHLRSSAGGTGRYECLLLTRRLFSLLGFESVRTGIVAAGFHARSPRVQREKKGIGGSKLEAVSKSLVSRDLSRDFLGAGGEQTIDARLTRNLTAITSPRHCEGR